MKKINFAKSIFALICVLCIVIGSTFTAYSTPQTSSDATWYSLEELLSVQKKDKEFILNIKVNGKDEKLSLSFPSLGGVRLNGANKGFFSPKNTNTIKYTENANGTLTLSANTGISAVVNTASKPWSIKLCDNKGKVVTEYTGKTLWFGYKGTSLHRVCVENTLDTNEVIYGLGERFNSFNRVGISTLTANEDAWSTKDTSYKNVPIIHSSKGYTFFYNSASVATADIGKSNSKMYSYDARGDKLDFYVWIGEPLENLQAYTSLTGTTMIPPKWAFHYMPGATTIGWKSTANPNELLTGLIDGLEKYGITETKAVFGEEAFRGNIGAYNYLHPKGIRMLMWNAPFQVDNMYRKGELLRNLPGHSSDFADYDLPIFRNGNSTGYHGESSVDFSHPAAKEMVQNLWKWEIEHGLGGLMLDYGEHIGYTQDLIAYNDMYAYEAHNFNSYYYAKTYYEAFNEKIGKGDWLNYMRSGAAGTQSYATAFAGDQQSTFEGMRQALTGMISAGASGFSIYGTDIGGLGGGHSKELYARWLQMSTFSPLMRAHGSDGAEEPWKQCDMNIFLEHYWLREGIIDKIYSSVIASNKNGAPLVQAMALAFPKNKELLTCDDQYLFCDDFLVCPVLSPITNKRAVALPNGSWTDMRTGKIYEGNKNYTIDAPEYYTPVLIRAGAVIPVDVSKDTLSLYDSKQNGNSIRALLVTKPDDSRTTEFWASTENATKYTNKTGNGNTFVVSADKSQKTNVILASGVNATAVSVDGTSLKKLNKLPSNESNVGYFVDGRERTVIRLPANKSWSKVSIRVGDSLHEDYALNKKVTVHSNAFVIKDSKPEFINDGNLDTSWIIKRIKDAFFEIDLGREYEINEIVFKWNLNFAEKYSIEASKDGQNWQMIKYIENGDGGIDTVSFDATAARYVRVANLSTQKANTVEIYDFNVYGKTKESVASVEKDESPEPEKDEGAEELEEDVLIEEEELLQNPSQKTSKQKNHTLLYIVLAFGGVIVAAGATLLIILLVKRKKSQKI